MESINIFYGVVEESFNIINQILLMYLLKKCEVKVDTKSIIFIFLSLISSFLLGKVLNNLIYTIIFNLFIQFLIFMKIVDVCRKERIVYFIFTLILESFLIGIVKTGFDNLFDKQGWYSLNSMFAMMFLFTIIAIIFLYKKNKFEGNNEKINSYIYLFLTVGFLTGLFLILLVDIFGSKLSIEMNVGLLVVAFLTIIANIMLYVFYIKEFRENISNRNELITMEQLLDMQEKYFDETVESYKELRCFRHDINGYFNTIDELITKRNYEELLSLTKNLKSAVEESVKNSCNNIYISATLNQFLHTIKAEDINFTFEYDVLKEIKVNNNHLCSLIYNLMSNAIEGTIRNTNKRYVNLNIYEKNKALVIKVTNSVHDDFSLSNLKIGVSTKVNKTNHGIGLKNIKMIVKKYNGNIDFKLNEDELEIYVILLQVLDNKAK